MYTVAVALLLATGNAYTFSNTRAVPRFARTALTMAATDVSTQAVLATAARDARGLALDSISSCHSGHLGLPLGCAEIGAELWGKHLSYNPADPLWLNRDRFILSAGHGSMFLYSWLHLSGYALPLEEVKNFRRYHSMTPGHPEFPSSQHATPGIEATTGPLGAGIGNAVGMAAAAKLAAARFNTADHKIIDHHIIALCGDGCLQEGVAFEAASFAGHEGLDNLIVIYDANDVTLDKMADFTQSENHSQRFQSIGWNTLEIDGHDLSAIDSAIGTAKTLDNGKPTIIIARTIVGKGITEVEGTNAAHGEAGVPFQKNARANMGLPADQLWYVDPSTRAFFEKRQVALKEDYNNWTVKYNAWAAANPALAKELNDGKHKNFPNAAEVLAAIPAYDAKKNVATRQSGADVLQFVSKAVPQFISGSADLHGSTKNYINGAGNFGNPKIKGKDYAGKNFYFGIREHAMGTMMNGMSYYGLNIPSGATFLVFADYMRAALRVAALSELQTVYILTHDSVGVGEDGPTHQPVEATSALRIIPHLDVIRPADPEEVAGAFAACIDRKDGPTALIFSRQNVRTLNEIDINVRREGVLKGAYVAITETAPLTHIILSSGSELQWAIDAAKELGAGVRVVSVPCMERFDRQSAEYKESVLPSSVTKRVAIEAGVSGLWYKYVGLNGKVIGTDKFGFSAPGDVVMKEFGITKENVVAVAKSL